MSDDQNKFTLKSKIASANSWLKVSLAATFLTVSGAGYVNSQMDDGERFDAHQYAQKLVKNSPDRGDPSYSDEYLSTLANRTADETEKNIQKVSLIFSLSTVLASSLLFSRRRYLEKKLSKLEP